LFSPCPQPRRYPTTRATKSKSKARPSKKKKKKKKKKQIKAQQKENSSRSFFSHRRHAQIGHIALHQQLTQRPTETRRRFLLRIENDSVRALLVLRALFFSHRRRRRRRRRRRIIITRRM